jgi:hypothetical protein
MENFIAPWPNDLNDNADPILYELLIDIFPPSELKARIEAIEDSVT